jgi:hypothetical protein
MKGIMLSEIHQSQEDFLYVRSKIVKLIAAENRKMVARGWEKGKGRDAEPWV